MDNNRLKVEKDRHEMGKSFARAADDEDMNDQLKVYRNIGTLLKPGPLPINFLY